MVPNGRQGLIARSALRKKEKELLKKSAVWRNRSFAATPVHAQDPGLTAKLHGKMSEVDKGFLKGPFEVPRCGCPVEAVLPPMRVWARSLCQRP